MEGAPVVEAPSPLPRSPAPPVTTPLDPGAGWRHFCWKKAHARAWKTPPREIALARLARAEALGMSYQAYTAVLLDTGRHL